MRKESNDYKKNISYSFWSNCFAYIISLFNALIIPKCMTVDNYGYWQVFLFYATYAELLNMGWMYGIYLKDGGKYIEQLDLKKNRAQFWLTAVFDFILICGVIVYAILNRSLSSEYRYIFILLIIFAFFFLQKFFLLNELQAIGKIKVYAIMLFAENIVYLISTLVFIYLDWINFYYLILIYTFSQFVALVVGIINAKVLVFGSLDNFKNSIKDAKENIRIGYKLMLASIASTLIIGIVRFGIQFNWDITVFAKISLTITVSNMLMKFINALAIPLFPMLRRMEQDKIKSVYNEMYKTLMVVIFGILVFYYPMKIIIGLWLPQYYESIQYAAILMPICIFEGKVALVINTYMKTLRMEKKLLICNIFAVCLSLILMYITSFVLKNLFLAIVSVVMIIAIRSIIAQIMLSKRMGFNCAIDVLIEVFFATLFVFCNYYLDWVGMIIYFLTYCIYLFYSRKHLKNSYVKFLKKGNTYAD